MWEVIYIPYPGGGEVSFYVGQDEQRARDDYTYLKENEGAEPTLWHDGHKVLPE